MSAQVEDLEGQAGQAAGQADHAAQTVPPIQPAQAALPGRPAQAALPGQPAPTALLGQTDQVGQADQAGQTGQADQAGQADKAGQEPAGQEPAGQADVSGPLVLKEPVEFVSYDGTTTVHGFIWWPAVTGPKGELEPRMPRGVVQLVHGMCEHIDRYDPFARFLTAQGFAVCGHDHVGHGHSVPDRSKWGCLPVKTGRDVLVEDVHAMRALMEGRLVEVLAVLAPTVPAVPFFVFGHSMGSFVVRAYIGGHAEGLAGAIVCGTGTIPPALSKAGNLLARAIAAVKGADSRSPLLMGMSTGSYNKGIAEPRTEYDWLSHNRANVDAYVADDACGFMFSAGGIATLTALTGEVCTPKSFVNVPRDLPILYIAGAEDPVGSSGVGVQTAYEQALAAGMADVQVKLYDGMRHEILNEDARDLVYTDVLAWLVAHGSPAA